MPVNSDDEDIKPSPLGAVSSSSDESSSIGNRNVSSSIVTGVTKDSTKDSQGYGNAKQSSLLLPSGVAENPDTKETRVHISGQGDVTPNLTSKSKDETSSKSRSCACGCCEQLLQEVKVMRSHMQEMVTEKAVLKKAMEEIKAQNQTLIRMIEELNNTKC